MIARSVDLLASRGIDDELLLALHFAVLLRPRSIQLRLGLNRVVLSGRLLNLELRLSDHSSGSDKLTHLARIPRLSLELRHYVCNLTLWSDLLGVELLLARHSRYHILHGILGSCTIESVLNWWQRLHLRGLRLSLTISEAILWIHLGWLEKGLLLLEGEPLEHLLLEDSCLLLIVLYGLELVKAYWLAYGVIEEWITDIKLLLYLLIGIHLVHS